MGVPKGVTETIAELKAKRFEAAAVLDAIDLAIQNLERVYGSQAKPRYAVVGGVRLHAGRLVKRRKVAKRAKRHQKAPAAQAEPKSAPSPTAPSERREAILELLQKSVAGMTMAEIRQRTPKMNPTERRNALQRLKLAGDIRREGNSWVKAA